MSDQTINLGFVPRAWQQRVINSLKRFSVLVVHRRGGKTLLAVLLLVDAAIRTRKTAARYAYVAPFLKQAKQIAWDYLRRYAAMIPGTKINEGELWVELPNGARIRIHGADNPDALRGIYLDGVVLDEVAQMRPDTWGEIVRPSLMDRHGWAIFLGTPKGQNLFSELYHRAAADPAWYAARFTVQDTDALNPQEIEQAKREMTDAQFRQEMLCDFSAATENALIPVGLVDDARHRTLHESAWMHAPLVLGVDVARFGDDRSVIVARQGLQVSMPIIMRGLGSQDVADRVAQEIARLGPAAVFVDGTGGYGAGVIDRLDRLGHTSIEVQFGGKPNDLRYANKRTEMWFEMAEWVKTGALPDLPDWSVDLCAPLYTYRNAHDRIALESKDSIKKRGLPSPDLGDALACTFAATVAAHYDLSRPGIFAGNGMAIIDYDPMANA